MTGHGDAVTRRYSCVSDPRVVVPLWPSSVNRVRLQKRRGPCGGVAAIGDAVGDADRAEAATGHEESRDGGEALLDGGEALEMPDFILRALSRPAEDARKQRVAADAEEFGEFASCRLDEFGVRPLEAMRIAT